MMDNPDPNYVFQSDEIGDHSSVNRLHHAASNGNRREKRPSDQHQIRVRFQQACVSIGSYFSSALKKGGSDGTDSGKMVLFGVRNQQHPTRILRCVSSGLALSL